MNIKGIKFREDVKLPVRAHYNDAGLDCFATEDFTLPIAKIVGYEKVEKYDYYTSKLVKEKMPIYETTPVPLGFGLEVPDGHVALILPRSSMNMKTIITYLGVIDSGYRGEIKAGFTNLSKQDYHFKKGDKICQIVILPCVLGDVVEELNNDRGTGGFGSTGR